MGGGLASVSYTHLIPHAVLRPGRGGLAGDAGQLHPHNGAVAQGQGVVHIHRLRDAVADAQADVGRLEGGVRLGKDGVDLSLQLLGGVHHAHEFPDEDVALAVHQLVARLGQHPGALGGDQVALGGQQIGHGG